jgi:hypothetical protein
MSTARYDLHVKTNADDTNGFRNILFSKSGGYLRIHFAGRIHFQPKRDALLPIHHRCAISKKQRSLFVPDSGNGRSGREPDGPLAVGSFDVARGDAVANVSQERPGGTAPIVAWHEVPGKASFERTVP